MMKNKKKEDNEIVSGMGGGTWEGEMAIQELFMEFENNKERNNNGEKKKFCYISYNSEDKYSYLLNSRINKNNYYIFIK